MALSGSVASSSWHVLIDVAHILAKPPRCTRQETLRKAIRDLPLRQPCHGHLEYGRRSICFFVPWLVCCSTLGFLSLSFFPRSSESAAFI